MYIPVLLSGLTKMENVVIGLMLSGKANKCIAGDLILSQRTIEAHRANVFQKMRVRNAMELVQMLSNHDESRDQRRHSGPIWFSSSEIGSTSG